MQWFCNVEGLLNGFLEVIVVKRLDEGYGYRRPTFTSADFSYMIASKDRTRRMADDVYWVQI